MATSGSFHWSKDFVEHLRVVHFSIALTSIVLMITAFNRQDVRLATALTQIELISSFEKRWNTVPAKIFLQAFKDAKLVDSFSTSLGVSFSKGLYPGDHMVTFFDVSPKDLAASDEWKIEGLSLPDELNNLNDFEIFWNSAHKGFWVPLPERLSRDSKCDETLLVNWSDGSADRLNDISAVLDPSSPVASCTVGLGLMEAISGPHLAFRQRLFTYGNPDRLQPSTEGVFGLTFDLPPEAFKKYQENGRKIRSAVSQSYISVHVMPYKTDERILSKLFFGGSRLGDFDAVFPELKKESGGIEFLDISEAVHRIESRPSSTQQNLSLLGVAVPLVDVSLWGIFLLVGTQLYLLLHLRELAARISPDADGWDVAWIGIYQTRLSAAMTILSACVLPDCSAVILAYRALAGGVSKLIFAGYVSVVTISVFVSILTVLKLMQLRREVSLSGTTSGPEDTGTAASI